MKKEKESAWLVFPPLALLALALYLSMYTPDTLRTLIERAVILY